MIGNDHINKQIKIALAGAQHRNTALPHMLFAGAPGCGKTTLAEETANIGDMDFVKVPPDSIKGYKEVVDLLGSLNHEGYNKNGDVVGKIRPTIIFMDEMHRLPILGQESLGIAMESYQLESDKDKSRAVWFPLFTIVGATTEEGMLSKPYRDRFTVSFTFKLYDDETLARIVAYHASKKGVGITKRACFDIAKRSRGTPRIAVRYLNRALDYELFYNTKKKDTTLPIIITPEITNNMFDQIGIDEVGLDENERKLLIELYKIDMPVGMINLSLIINVSTKTISDSIEPFLIHKGFIMRSGRGRILTQTGKDYVSDVLLGSNKGSLKKRIPTTYKRKLTASE